MTFWMAGCQPGFSTQRSRSAPGAMEQREEGEYPALYRPGMEADLIAADRVVEVAERDPARRRVGVGVNLFDQLFADRVARQPGGGEHLPVGLGVTVRNLQWQAEQVADRLIP